MAERPPDTAPDAARSIDAGAFRIVIVLGAILLVLMGIRLVADAGRTNAGLATGPGAPASAGALPTGGTATAPGWPPSATTPAVELAAYLIPDPQPAPELDLHGPDGPLDLDALRGAPVLVFFGYTHCPDVCPATLGTVGVAIDDYGHGARALFVSVDPERDTPEWLAEFERYMPAGFSAVSGSPTEVRAAADAWGVRYARVEADDPAAYLMSHTADVFLVDAGGTLRARFPFGTDAATMMAVVDALDPPGGSATPPAATPAPAGSATPATTQAPVADLEPLLVSSSVWAGGSSPVIFTLGARSAPGSEPASLTVQPVAIDGAARGPLVSATAVHPSGIDEVSYLAFVDLPAPGSWRLIVTAGDADGTRHTGVMPVTALDQGGSAALGSPAPTDWTQVVGDVGGNLTYLTTDPLPDARLHATSTADALAGGKPFVLVVDSWSFKVTPQCGQAIVLAKRLLDRWGSVPFIHHEPYRYDVVTTEPAITGSIQAPVLTGVATAWGVGGEPWGVFSMPWLFVVDGDGIVRAKYQGIMGSADVDVLLTYLEGAE